MSVSLASRAKKQVELASQKPVVMEEEDVVKASPIGRFIEGWVDYSSPSLDGQYGPALAMSVKLDDATLESVYNGKKVFFYLPLDAKSVGMRDFCRILNARKILTFDESQQVKSKTGGWTLMQNRLVENIDDVCGVWNPDERHVIGGKLVGNKIGIHICRVAKWVNQGKTKSPDQFVWTVDNPDGKALVYDKFVVDRLAETVSGEKYLGGQTSAPETPYYEDLDDDIPF